MICLAILISIQQPTFGEYSHFLHRVKRENFEYQTKSHFAVRNQPFDSELAATTAAKGLQIQVTELRRQTPIKSIRSLIGQIVVSREAGLATKVGFDISRDINHFFLSFPERMKELSRQDVLALAYIDSHLTFSLYQESYKPFLNFFRDLPRSQFETIDICLSFLKISRQVRSKDAWINERLGWSLAYLDKVDPQGLRSVINRSIRQAGYAIANKNLKLFDRSFFLLNRCLTNCKLPDAKKDLTDTIKMLQEQKDIFEKKLKKSNATF